MEDNDIIMIIIYHVE